MSDDGRRDDRAHRMVLPDAPDHLRATLEAGGAIAWEEPVTIDTYLPDDPSTLPMFLDSRVYQGSSGRVYPLPFYERIASEPESREWRAIHLENRYLRLMILPELGGRIHVGFDKTTGYDFFYRNTVIKPALVGLAGPWISGGVEFNWPQHHRPATFLPVETMIEHDDDGSVVVWCSDHDPFTRMQGTHGVRIHPDRSIVQLDVRLHNRTSERQTFLWWANVAVRVHDDYQSFFPEDVRFVADHARRSITAFPQADRPYYGVDYPARAAENPGADRLDFYRNIPVPTSYMVTDTADDFFGGYDHAAGAGFVHWADRRIAPGKKQWTWGDAAFGRAWDAHLTDDDGPYIELMAGVFTDNQPDFSWLAPGETKRFSQFWYPIADIGVVHQATPDAAVHVDRDGVFIARFAVTSPQTAARAEMADGDGRVLAEHTADLVPGAAWTVDAGVAWTPGSTVQLLDGDGVELVSWAAKPSADEPQEEQPSEGAPVTGEPWTASEPPLPDDVDSTDELYLTGLHLQQNRHPTRSPSGYWLEAVRRDPGDSRSRLALAEHDYRAGDYASARDHVTAALGRVTRRNANPRDAEGYYLLGLIEARCGRRAAAAAAWAKAMWDSAYQGPAGFELARLAARDGSTATATATATAAAVLADLDELDAVAASDRRRAPLRVVLLRRLGRTAEADAALEGALARDPMGATLRYLRSGTLPSDGATMTDVALELARAGDTESALGVLSRVAAIEPSGAGNAAPLAHYHRAGILDQVGRHSEATAARADARSADQRWAFARGLDDHDALVAAIAAESAAEPDAVAPALLGMLLFDVGRRAEALAEWEHAIAAGSRDAIVYRNAGLASYNIAHDDERAVRHYERALELAPNNPRLLFEFEQLAARLGVSAEQRLERLEQQLALVHERDDLVIEWVDLLLVAGRASEALDVLTSRRFQPWEGGEGRALSAWDRSHAALDLPIADPPATLGEARTEFVAPVARHEGGETDYFATSLPELLLFRRE